MAPFSLLKSLHNSDGVVNNELYANDIGKVFKLQTPEDAWFGCGLPHNDPSYERSEREEREKEAERREAAQRIDEREQ